MKERGHRVAIASLDFPPDDLDGTASVLSHGLGDVPCLQLDSAHRRGGQAVGELIEFARQHCAEVVEAHDAREPAGLAMQLREATGVPYLVKMHGGDVAQHPSPQLPQIIRNASAVCPVSRFLADLLTGKRAIEGQPEILPIEIEPGKLRICSHGQPLAFIAAEPAPQRDDLQIVCSIGYLFSRGKGGHQYTIEAVAGLADEFPGLRLRIIGGGSLAAEFKEQARALGIAGRVEITGYQDWPTVMKMAGECHLLVQGSRVEGFCLPSLEGAAQGLPLLLTPTGVHEECIRPGENGYLFDFGDVAALRQYLRSLLLAGTERRRRMGAVSLDIVRQHFVFEQQMPRLEAILQAVRQCRPLPA